MIRPGNLVKLHQRRKTAAHNKGWLEVDDALKLYYPTPEGQASVRYYDKDPPLLFLGEEVTNMGSWKAKTCKLLWGTKVYTLTLDDYVEPDLTKLFRVVQ